MQSDTWHRESLSKIRVSASMLLPWLHGWRQGGCSGVVVLLCIAGWCVKGEHCWRRRLLAVSAGTLGGARFWCCSDVGAYLWTWKLLLVAAAMLLAREWCCWWVAGSRWLLLRGVNDEWCSWWNVGGAVARSRWLRNGVVPVRRSSLVERGGWNGARFRIFSSSAWYAMAAAGQRLTAWRWRLGFGRLKVMTWQHAIGWILSC